MSRLLNSKVLATATCLGLTAAVFGIVVAIGGYKPLPVISILLKEGVSSWHGVSETVLKTIPILFCAIAVAVPGRLGMINIGGEGQMILGAIGATFAVYYFPEAGFCSMPLMFMTAVIAGSAWGLLPGLMRGAFKTNETLFSLLLNYVALLLLLLLIHGPWQDPASAGWPQSVEFPVSYRLSSIAGSQIHSLIFSAIILVVLLAAIGKHTIWGFAARIIESNEKTASYLKINVPVYYTAAFCIAGAIAAIGGMGEVAGVQGRLREGLSLGYGYAGFFVAWLCGNRFMWLPLGSFLFAIIVTGADSLQVHIGMPFSTVYLLQGLLFLALLAYPKIKQHFDGYLQKTHGPS